MVCGLGVTIGLVFSDKNVMLERGLDQTENGVYHSEKIKGLEMVHLLVKGQVSCFGMSFMMA
jgi:hypothetical protein